MTTLWKMCFDFIHLGIVCTHWDLQNKCCLRVILEFILAVNFQEIDVLFLWPHWNVRRFKKHISLKLLVLCTVHKCRLAQISITSTWKLTVKSNGNKKKGKGSKAKHFVLRTGETLKALEVLPCRHDYWIDCL